MERISLGDEFRDIISVSPEAKRRLIAADAVYSGLLRAYRNHLKLGEAGKLKDKENQFGEMALRADIEAEEHVLECLTYWAEEKGINLEYRGEELKTGYVGDSNGETYLALLDGLDGSANYLKKTDFPYGTMVAIARGENPTYDDFEVTGIMMPEEGWIILAVKDRGVWVYDIESGKSQKLPPFDSQEKYDTSKVLADDYFPEAKQLLGEKVDVWSRTGSTAATTIAISIRDRIQEPIEGYSAMNAGWQALVDVTRKGNLEQPVVFRTIRELRGDMVDKNGKSIADKPFNTFGQKDSQGKEIREPVITVINNNVLEGIFSELGLERT